MLNSTDDYADEILDGNNARTVKCKHCSSVILVPGTATYSVFEFDLPTMLQKKDAMGDVQTEKIYSFWTVNQVINFQNVGFSNTVKDCKYLTCADCDAGPIGYHDIPSRKSYVALCRVQHV